MSVAMGCVSDKSNSDDMGKHSSISFVTEVEVFP